MGKARFLIRRIFKKNQKKGNMKVFVPANSEKINRDEECKQANNSCLTMCNILNGHYRNARCKHHPEHVTKYKVEYDMQAGIKISVEEYCCYEFINGQC